MGSFGSTKKSAVIQLCITIAFIVSTANATLFLETAHRNTACVNNTENGVVDLGEACDNNLPGCIACQQEYGYHCKDNVCNIKCGDGMLVSPFEECDDKNSFNGDGCDNTCKEEIGWACTTGIHLPTKCKNICGDGILIPSKEQCDDGNSVDFDGCTSECDILDYSGRFRCTTDPNKVPATFCIDNCGDGFNVNKNLNGTYVPGKSGYCDDGNNKNGDGCSSKCTIEFGFICTNGNLLRTDHCTDICGDGLIVGSRDETECDDGNFINGDGCDLNCKVEKDYACDGGTSTSNDRCWYYLHYRPSIKSVNIRSNGFIAILLNDTVITHNGYFTSDEIGITINDEIHNNSLISFDWRAYYGSHNTIIIKIESNELLKGGKYSVLNLDFKNKVMYSDLLRLIENKYSIEMKENPTHNKIGIGFGITFQIIFGFLFIFLCILIIADLQNLCAVGLVCTLMQRIFMILLANCRPSEILTSFWTYFGIVNFKTSYFNFLFRIQITEIDIAMNSHRYNSLGWFGFDTSYLLNNSAGSLSLILVLVIIILISFTFLGFLNVLLSKQIIKTIFNNFQTVILQALIIIQILTMNDLTLSIFINMGSLKFSNATEIYSSIMCLILCIAIFSLILIPLGLISNNKFKDLMSESFVHKAGVYYQSILRPPIKEASFPFLSYYSVISMAYSVIFSIIIVSLGSVQYSQLPMITILNGIYLLFACYCPFNQRFLNIINIANHVGVFVSSLLICSTLGVSSYDDYPLYANICCTIVIAIIFFTFIFTMAILFIRLFFPFIRGLKNGCKFEPIVHYNKEDKEAVAPEVVLPDTNNAGHIQYDESYVQRFNCSEQTMTISRSIKAPSAINEETKGERTIDIKRKEIYSDQAI